MEVVECLTAYGANINTADSKGNTALSLASFSVSTRTEAVVETLIKVWIPLAFRGLISGS